MNKLLLALSGAVLAVAVAAAADQGAASKRPLTASQAAAGKAVYLRECSGCHGERGRGDGPAAQFIEPLPRDFTSARFKLRTTLSGLPPTTADIERTILRGIPGTAMPSFSFLSPEERRQAAAYVLKLAELLDEPEPRPIAAPGKAPVATPEQLAKGKELYMDAGCFNCHGERGKGDGPAAKEMKDDAGRPIAPRDFTDGVFRGGAEPVDIYYRFATGMDGTPMPSYGDLIEGADMWALVNYVLSLRVPPAPQPLPKDPIEAGRRVAAKYSCRGCHVLDDGNGGNVGPDLRVSGQKLASEWVRTFLKNPRAYGKIYPWRVHRMPYLGLNDEEVATMTSYLATMGKKPEGPLKLPDPKSFPQAKLNEGQLLYMVRCTECHNLGKVVETPPIKRQGPDLIRVDDRIDYEWAKEWITNPKKIDPKTNMVVPGLTPEQVDAVRMFVWKSAIEAGGADQAQRAASASR
jgi:cytochrome c oxidase cbb3-type subunit 2